jgi:hypothetical protein
MKASLSIAFETAWLVVLSLLALGSFSNAPFSSQAAPRQMGQASTSQTGGGPVTNGLQAIIEAQRAPIPEDQPLAIVFRVTNLGEQNFDFGWCRNSWQPNFTVAVTTDRGEPISGSGPGLGMASFTGGRIGPGRQHVEVGDLREQYPLGPGKYYVTAIENFERADGPPIQAPSNTIEITVGPAIKGSMSDLRLSFGQAQWVFDPADLVKEGLRLTNSGDHDIDIGAQEGQPWFHNVTLEFTTVAGDTVPTGGGDGGQELSLEKDGWGPHRSVLSGPLRLGDFLDADVMVSKLYKLTPGTAYTLVAHQRLYTSDGPMELVSNIVTFAIRAR